MEKLKVIIIDDESLIRKLIRMKVDWDALNMVVIAEFSSSKKALSEVKQLQPDIIITDICMPGMDGIEFSEECINLLPNIKIIILTGYDEFEYAKKSIHIGVADYLLKPVNGEEIVKSLKEMSRKIYEERAKYKEYDTLALEIKENLSIYYDAYLNQALQQSQTSESFVRKMNFFQQPINPASSSIQVAVIAIEMPQKNSEQMEANEMFIYLKAKQLTESFFSGDNYLFFCRDGIGRIVIICNNSEIPFLDCLELLKKMLITRLKCYIAIGVGTQKEDYSQMTLSYKEAVESLSFRVVEGNNCLIYYEDIGKSDHVLSAEEERIWNETKIFIRAGLTDKAESSIHTLWQLYEQSVNSHIHQVRSMYVKICSWCFNEAVRQELTEQSFYQEQAEKATFEEQSVYEFKREAILCVDKLAKAMALRDEKKSDSMIHEILSFMSQNLGDPELSMNKVAEHAYISTGYLGRILKKYTGKTYGEYLSELRFERVKELLKATDLKGYQIGEKIGILDAHYLSIWFKKMSGYSLSDYRKCIKGRNNESLK